jgi:hypothetical protein
MKKTFKAIWLALMGVMWLFLMATSCHKTPDPIPEPDLPPETQTGAGTVGCYINGKPWWPKPFLAIGVNPHLEVKYGGVNPGLLYLSATISKNPNSSSLTIFVKPWVRKGDNEIWYTLLSDYAFINYDTAVFKNPCNGFRIDTLKTKRLTITKLDTVGVGIVSGTFEFTAFNTCGDTLRFTKGRFDY